MKNLFKNRKTGVYFILILIIFLIVISLVFVSAFNFNKNVLKVTDEHPFFVTENCFNSLSSKNQTQDFSCNGSWVVAKDLHVGDELFTIDGKIARIVGIKDVDENVLVYNLGAEKYNDFIVGEGVIVHNSNAVRNGETVFFEASLGQDVELINDLFGTSVRFKDGATTFIKDTSELGYIYDFGSVVKQDRIFLKEASKFGHQTSERMEAMIERLLGGGDPGKGSHTLTGVSNSVLEATSQGKERIYYRIKHIEGQRSQLIILAYSLKDSSQKRVIDHLQVLYPPGYKFP